MIRHVPAADPSQRLVGDELDGLVSTLSARFPEFRRSEIGGVVAAVYAGLVAQARISTHLIPLTLNLSRRLLSSSSVSSSVTPLTFGTDPARHDGRLAGELCRPA